MQQEFQSIQSQIYDLQYVLDDARNNKKWHLESQIYRQIEDLKTWQRDNVSQNWSWFIKEWFSTDSPAQRLNICLEWNIVEIKSDNQEKLRFVTNRHFVRAPITKAKELRFWTYWRDNAQCVYCDKKLDKTSGQIDHVIPISAWPAEFIFLAEDSSNLAASCKKCNRDKLNFLQILKKPLLHIEVDTCLPQQNSFLEPCPNSQRDDCKVCALPSIQVFCNVHGLVHMQLCSLTAMKKYLGHN